MKNIIKNNLKTIIAFILGMLVSGIGATAVTLSFASGDVEHTKSDGTKTNVKAAINDLYSKATAGDATSDQLLSGKKALSKGTLLTGTMNNYSSSTAQSCTTANTSNKLYVKPANAGYYTANSSFNTNINYNPNKTVAASTSTATATANGNTTATTINLDKDKKVTIPAGYYSAATTVQNVAGGSEYDVYMAITCGTDRDTKGYVESAALFPASSSENTKYAYYDTDGTKDGAISVTGITLTLQGYSSGFHYKVKATKAGTLYNAKTGSIIKSLSVNEEYTLSDDHTVGVAKINVYYFKFS